MHSVLLLQRDHEASPRLRAVVDAVSGLWVCGVAHTVEEARGLIKRTQPDILVSDVRVQDGFVFRFLNELRHMSARASEPHVLVSMLSYDEHVLLEALRNGADGYWAHTEPSDVLIAGLRQLARGESPITPTIARHVLSHFRRPALRPGDDFSSDALDSLQLTRAEQALLMWVAQGYLIDEIADQWRTTPHDVGVGVRGVYHKLQFDRSASGLSLTGHPQPDFTTWAASYQ